MGHRDFPRTGVSAAWTTDSGRRWTGNPRREMTDRPSLRRWIAGRAKRRSHSCWRVAAAAALLSGVALALTQAEAHRFYADGRRDRSVEVEESAERWSSDTWHEGTTLVFDVAPDPEFEVYFDSSAVSIVTVLHTEFLTVLARNRQTAGQE